MGLNVAVYSRTAVTVGATEYSIVNNSTTIASLTTVGSFCCTVDPVNVAAGDEFELALHEKVRSGGTQRRTVLQRIVPQSGIIQTITFQLGHGWDFTLKKITGTDRTFDITIRGYAG